MKVYIAHSSQFDYKNKLYKPLRASKLNEEHELFFPQDGKGEELSRHVIEEGDALVAEVSAPSLGTGIEMGWADAAGVPVIAMYEEWDTPSFSIDHVVTERFSYESPEDMVRKLAAALEKI